MSAWDQLKIDADYLGKHIDVLGPRDQEFGRSLLQQWQERGLSAKQEYWVGELANRARKAQPKPVAAEPAKIDLGPIVALFRKGSTNLKKPFVLVSCDNEDGDVLRLKLAGTSSRYAGQVYVYLNGAFEERLWLGRVDEAGRYWPSREATDQRMAEITERTLVAFAADPVAAAVRYGRTVGACCFCSRTLNDPRSITVGYGPICAGHYGLPWGEVVEEPTFKCEPNEPKREFEYAGFWYGEIDGRLQPCPGQHAAAAKQKHVMAARDEFAALRARKQKLEREAYENRPKGKIASNHGRPFDDEIPF